jgi:hypothetical protein
MNIQQNVTFGKKDIISLKTLSKAADEGGEGMKQAFEIAMPKLETMQGDALNIRVKYKKTYDTGYDCNDKAIAQIKVRKAPSNIIGRIFKPWKRTEIDLPFYLIESEALSTKKQQAMQAQKINNTANSIISETANFINETI